MKALVRRILPLRILVLLAAVATLVACGTKGPLYLPPPDNDDGPTRRTR